MCKRVLASQTSGDGDVPFYKIGTIGNIPDAYISRELHDEYKRRYNYPKKGELLITCAGTVGKCVVFNGEDAYFQDSNIVWINNPTFRIDNGFLYHCVSQVDWSKLNSTTIIRIYNDNLRNLKIPVPSKEEQVKIATFLSLLDNRIATQSQIIKELESLIKGLIMYFVKGKEPNAQLKDCLTCHASTLMESAVAGKTGEYPVYGAAGVIAHTPDFEIDGNAILIIKDGASVGKVQYATGKYSVIGTLNYLKPKGKVSLKYFYYYLQTFNFDKYRVGSGIPHIYFKDYGSEPVYCSPIENQTYIADFLSVIDEKLTTERRLLNAYTDQKKYLLANMFI